MVNKQYSSLWHPTVKTLSRQLQEQFGYTKDNAMMKVLLGQTMLNNGMPHLQLVEYFLYDLEFDSFDELQPFINLVNGMANNTPQWILRGWTSFEVFERYEKHNLQPLPEPPFDFMGSRIGEKPRPKWDEMNPVPAEAARSTKNAAARL